MDVAAASLQTVYTPGISLKLGPVIKVTNNTVSGYDPLEPGVRFAPGQTPTKNGSLAPAQAIAALNSPTPPTDTYAGPERDLGSGREFTESAPIINASQGSIVTQKPNGSLVVNSNDSSTTASELRKFLSGTVADISKKQDGSIVVEETLDANAANAANAAAERPSNREKPLQSVDSRA